MSTTDENKAIFRRVMEEAFSQGVNFQEELVIFCSEDGGS